MSKRIAGYIFDSNIHLKAAEGKLEDAFGSYYDKWTSNGDRELQLFSKIDDVDKAIKIIEECGGRHIGY